MKLKVKLLPCLVIVVSSTVNAEVKTDGTVGTAGAMTVRNISGQILIPQSLGEIKGSNLFHSFKTFNINNGESAVFTGADNLRNVISRVTGGEVSHINGLLKSEVGHANFYFINPAGVTFGATAQIDVPAAFYVSTADKLKFADDSTFSATHLASSALTIAEPASFGFLGHSNNAVSVNGSTLTTLRQNLNVVAGNIAVKNSSIADETGNIRLTAVGRNDATVPIKSVAAIANGAIIIENSTLSVSGNGGGKISLQGGNIYIKNNSRLLANNTDVKNASFEQGVNIAAENLTINNSAMVVSAYSSGNAGTTTIKSDSLNILNGGVILSLAENSGEAGDIKIDTKKVLIDGQGSPTGISASTYSNGSGGTVKITSDRLSILNAGVIGSATVSSGDAGDVNIGSFPFGVMS
jgi:filamentous hemagglutinin family protein